MPIIGTDYAKLALINLDTGAVDANKILNVGSSSLTFNGQAVYTDGIGVHAYIFEQTRPTHIIYHCIPNGNTFNVKNSESTSLFIDACFDGVFFWVLFSVTVYQLSGPNVTDSIVKQWNHGVASPRGIMTDGNNIIIMET